MMRTTTLSRCVTCTTLGVEQEMHRIIASKRMLFRELIDLLRYAKLRKDIEVQPRHTALHTDVAREQMRIVADA